MTVPPPAGPTGAQLLDLGVITAAEVAVVEDSAARLLGTTSDVLLLQAEAIVLLEAVAKGLAQPGSRALNVVTGPYGALFGRWLAAAGVEVVTLAVPYHRTVSGPEVTKALAAQHVDLVAVVHAEAATGGANAMDEIAASVTAHGALLVVDAVASVGGHPVTPDAWGADIVVIGGQKALAGPAGVSLASISPRAWSVLSKNPHAPRESVLSLLDLHDGWLGSGRHSMVGTPSSLESAALGQALDRVWDEGLDRVIARHRSAAAATRAGLRELGLTPWINDDAAAATVVTTIEAPAGDPAALVAAARAAGSRILGTAPGPLAATTLRINHTGRAANLDAVLAELTALAGALSRPADSAIEAAGRAWSTDESTDASTPQR